MDQRTTQILFALVRSAICGTKLPDIEKVIYSTVYGEELFCISKKHDILHLISLGLEKYDFLLTDFNNDVFRKSILATIYRHEQLDYEYNNLCKILEIERIQYLPLKGAVIRDFYPEPWMRTSCDIDILVREEDVEKAKFVLINDYGYSFQSKGSHDISFFSPNDTCIELHYKLIEDRIVKNANKVLSEIWNVVERKEGYEFCYKMPDEYLYFYHIAHMAKHFQNGGCGIRSVLDLWILNQIPEVNMDRRNILLQKGGLLRFANIVRELSGVWFENKKHDSITLHLEKFIICGGIYGNNGNRIIVKQQKKGGKAKYALSKIFIPYEEIKFHYPILQKHHWLLPIMEVRRWCKLLFCGHRNRVMKELNYNNNIDKKDAKIMQQFLRDIGLYEDSAE